MRILATVLLATLGLAGCSDDEGPGPLGPPAGKPAPAQERAGGRAPNFVVVLTDDQEPGTMSVMPQVAKLAAEGVTYTDAFASVPECCPSRATLLTGQYAHNHGVRSNEPPDGGFGAFADSNTVAVWLDDAGYRTGYVGKYLNGYGWDALGHDPAYVPPGWDYWAALTNHTEYGLYGYDINEDGEIESAGGAPRDYQTDVLAEKAEGFVHAAAERERPFFLQVATTAPHDEGVLEDEDVPRNPRPAKRHRGRFERVALPRGPAFNEADVSDKPRFVRRDPRLSRAEIERLTVLHRSRLESLLAVDDLVGRLRAALRETGELERTVFVFTSDNGFLLGQHRQTGKDKVYEDSAGVPLVVVGPGFAAGARATRPVSNVDLVATMVKQSGVEPGVELDGVPLTRAGGRRAILIEMLTKREFAAVRTRRYLLAEYVKGGVELYDLERDPDQLENLGRRPEARELRRRLSEQLARLRECAGAECAGGR